MSDEIFFDGKRYISANDAAASADLTRDYVARLCRDGKISGRRVGKHWYVEQESLKNFLVTQEYAKTLRSESLATERARQYQEATGDQFIEKTPSVQSPSALMSSVAPVVAAPVAAQISRVISSRADEIKNKMNAAVAAQTGDGIGQAKYLLSAPGGLAHAALSAVHVPVYALSPITEFFHKVVALALTLMLTFGTYAAVDPSYARFAADSVQENVNAALDSYHTATGGGLNELANRTQTQVAAAAENPASALLAVRGAVVLGVPRIFGNFARAFNKNVNNFIYAIAFPAALVFSQSFVGSSDMGSVAVEVTQSSNVDAISSSGNSTSIQSSASIQTTPTNVINNLVAERVVETTRLLSVGGISEEMLDKKLAALDRQISSRMLVSSAANTTNITNIYSSAAAVGRIEHLDGLDLTNPTLNGGNISGSHISSARSLSVSGTSTLGVLSAGETTLATTTVTGDLTLGGSLLFSGSSSTISATGATFTNATTTNATSTNLTVFTAPVAPYFTATSTFASTFPYASSTALTATNLFSTNFLTLGSTTLQNFTALNATTSNATSTTFFATTLQSTNATSTNLFATTASSTNLYSNVASIGALTGGTGAFSSTLAVTGASTFTGLSSFSNASTSLFSVFRNAYFGGTATTTIDSAGNIFAAGTVGIGASSVDASAVFQIDSTTKGFLPPRMTTAQKNAIGSAAAGLTVFDSSLNKLNVYNGSAWKNVGSTEIGGEVTSGTAGSVLFVGQGGVLGQDNANFAYSTSTSLLSLKSASSTQLSIFQKAYFGGTATSTFDSTGALTLVNALTYGGVTLSNAVTGTGNMVLSASPTMTGTITAAALNTSGIITSTAGTANVFPYASSTALTATNLFSTNFLTLGSTTLQNFTALNATTTGNAYFAGNVGIGTTTSQTAIFAVGSGSKNLFSVSDNSGNGALTISATGANTQNLTITPRLVSNTYFPSPMAGAGVGLISSTDVALSGITIHLMTGSGTGLFVAQTTNNVGIGTTTPTWLLNPSSATAPQLALSAGAGNAQWAFRNAGGNLYLATTTVAGTATTTTSAFSIIGSSGNIILAEGGGNVGIGTSTPWRTLSVTGSSDLGSNALAGSFTATSTTASSFAGGLTAFASSTIGAGGATTGLTISGGATTTGNAYFAGNVGIGTASPGVALDVVGTVKASNGFNSTSLSAGFQLNGSVILDYSGGVTRLRDLGGGISLNATAATNMSTIIGASTISTISSTGQAITGTLTTTGNVGIGTTSPGSLLSVQGGGYISSNLFVGGIITSTSSSASTFPYASSTALTATQLFATNLHMIGSTTLQNFTALNATSTTFATGVLCLTGDLPCRTTWPSAAGGAYPFALSGNATSTLTQFNGGLTAYASSTIGAGGQATGLTISGGATTTGNAYVAGNVGIGTTTPFATFAVNPIAGAASNQFVVGSSTATSLLVTNGGNLVLGHSSLVQSGGSNNPVLEAHGAIGIASMRWNAGTGGANVVLAHSRSASTGTHSALQVDDAFGTLNFQGSDGTSFVNNGALIVASVDGTVSTGVTPSRLTFSTQSSNGVSTERLRIDSSGNVGIGTTSPGSLLSVQGGGYISSNLFVGGIITSTSSSASTFPYASSTALTATNLFSTNFLTLGSTTLQNFTFLNATGTNATSTTFATGVLCLTGDLPCRTTWPSAAGGAYPFALSGNATSTLTQFNGGLTAFASSTIGAGGQATGLTISGGATTTGNAYFAGNVGIGTTTPFRKFSLTDTVSTAQAAIAYDTTRYAEMRVDSSGDLNIGASGNDIFNNNDNLWVCTGGSFTVNGCPAGAPTGQGNIIAENKIGVGTSTPAYKLTVETQDSTTDFLQIASSTAQSIFVVKANGRVGIGTSTPTTLLSIGGLLTVGASSTGQLATMGTATSTFNGDIKITGKLDVGTIDPVYTIDGVKYATYGHSTIGIHEETMQTIQLSEAGADGKYVYTIDFNKLEKGSDLWLFYQVTDMGQDWKGLVVALTPSFDGNVFYKKDVKNNRLVISGDAAGEVSMRLTAYRYDFTKWKNLRPDQEDDGYKGHEISSKLKPVVEGVNITQPLTK